MTFKASENHELNLAGNFVQYTGSHIFLTGKAGTGKTTFARALSQELGWMHLNTDVIRANLGMREQYDEKTKTFIYQKMLEHAETIVEQRNGLVPTGGEATHQHPVAVDPVIGL